MIVSHKYKFIFLKTNKTAGTSIEIALSKFCGPDDIITPISQEDEKTRENLGCRGPQNYLAPIWNYTAKDVARLLRRGIRKPKFYHHISAQVVKELMGEQVWNRYYKFCFERNPWDRLLSLYHWRCRTGQRPSITEFIQSDVPLVLKRKGFELYTINGEVVVDKVCRYEAIAEELEAVRVKLGIPDKLDLPQAKSRFRKDKRSYRELLDQNQQAKIAELFSEEIRLLGYEF